jgi:hypothetical protein
MAASCGIGALRERVEGMTAMSQFAILFGDRFAVSAS